MAKPRGPRIPKRIAGVKVPKRLRAPANAALELIDSPVVGDAIAAALVAGAGALADGKSRREIMKAAGQSGSTAAATAAKGGARFPLAFAIAAGELAAGLAGRTESQQPRPANRKKRRAKRAKV